MNFRSSFSSVSRRKFLAALPLVPAAVRGFAQTDQWLRVYFGTDTAKGKSKGIYHSRFNTITGELTAPVLAAETVRPSYLAIHPGRSFLYAVNELITPDATVTPFRIGMVSGKLSPLQPVPSRGEGPCFVSVHPEGTAAYVANYNAGTLASFGIRDGQLSAATKVLDGKAAPAAQSANPRQDASHLHCASFSPDARNIIACDLGRDRLYILHTDLRHNSFQSNKPEFVAARPGSGPRHVVFHPSGRFMYCIHELDNTIDLWDWKLRGDNVELTPRANAVYSLEESKSEKNTAAEIAISPDGRFVYASVRGEDTIVVYAVDDNNGTLKFVQRISTDGNTPRQFALTPSGMWLLVGNQDSGTVQVMRRDAETGKLFPPESRIQLDSVLYTLLTI